MSSSFRSSAELDTLLNSFQHCREALDPAFVYMSRIDYNGLKEVRGYLSTRAEKSEGDDGPLTILLRCLDYKCVSCINIEGRIGFREPGSVERDELSSVCIFYCNYARSVSIERNAYFGMDKGTELKSAIFDLEHEPIQW